MTRIEPREFLSPVGLRAAASRGAPPAVTSVGVGVVWGAASGSSVTSSASASRCSTSLNVGQAQVAVGVAVVAGQRGVGDLLVLVEREQLLLGQLLQHVPEDHDHRLVRDDHQPLAVVPQAFGGQQAADPQGDVRPALAARRPVVELAEQVAPLRLVRELLADAGAGHAVEEAEVALPQPFVGAHPDAELLRGQLRGGQRAVER